MIAKPENKATDEKLIEQALAGSQEAFRCLHDKYWGKLFAAIRQLIGPDTRRIHPDDVVQDAFVQAHLKLGTFGKRCAFYTWLYRIALNGLFSQRRRQRVREKIDSNRPPLETEHVTHKTPEGALEEEEQVVQVQEALAALSEDHRQIMVLRGVEGLDYDAIAETLELAPGTVRSRLSRARIALREQLIKKGVLTPS